MFDNKLLEWIIFASILIWNLIIILNFVKLIKINKNLWIYIYIYIQNF